MRLKKEIPFLMLTLVIFVTYCTDITKQTKNYSIDKSGISLRAEPLRDLKVSDTVRVRDYGAIPGDNRIDTESIQQAINEATGSKKKVLTLFEPGVYRLDATNRTGHALKVRHADGLILDGNGAKFKMTGPGIRLMKISKSQSVIARDFSSDFETSPHTQGWVTNINIKEKWLRVRIDSDWPDPDMKHFRKADYKWGFIKDKDNPVEFKEGTEYRLYLQDWKNVKGNIWQYETEYGSKLKSIRKGDPFVQISRVDGCFVSVGDSRDITLQNLRLYESPACMTGSYNTSRMNYLGVNMSPKEGSWLSSGADGSFNVNGRVGPWVEGSTFNALGDDNLVIKGTGGYIIDVKNDSTFALVRAKHRFKYPPLSFEEYARRDSVTKWTVTKDDLLEIYDPLSREITSEPVVTKTERLENSVLVTVDRPIPKIREGTTSDSSLTVLNQSNALPGFVVKDNKFLNAPRFGFLLKSHDGLVSDNTFKNHSDQSIAMINTYQEIGGRVYDIMIRGNRFVGAGGWPIKTAETAQHALYREKGTHRNLFSVVTAAFTVSRGQWDILETESIELRNLYIIGNEWYNWRQLPALTIMNARDVVVNDNYFEIENRFSRKDTSYLDKKPIRILNSNNVEIGPQTFRGSVLTGQKNVEVTSSDSVSMR
jgi:hypothetical protein